MRADPADVGWEASPNGASVWWTRRAWFWLAISHEGGHTRRAMPDVSRSCWAWLDPDIKKRRLLASLAVVQLP
jgi:hypothetical protein